MPADALQVFFYGLFMDEAVLAANNVHPADSATGSVAGYRLYIGERATLLPEPGGRAFGVLMTITAEEAASLYSEPSVADYVPERVVVNLSDDRQVTAVCYNLPADKLAGANPDYAAALLNVATDLGFPECYLQQIRAAMKNSQP